MNKQKVATTEMFLCAALWSIAGILIKQISWPGIVIAGMRSLFASAVVALFMIFTKKRLVINKKAIISAIFMCGTFMCFVIANTLTTSANTVVLEFTSPIFIMIMSFLLYGKRFSRSEIITVAVTILGIVLVAFDGLGGGRAIGNIVAIMAGFFMAGMYIFVGDSEGDAKLSGVLLGQLLTSVTGLSSIPFFDITMAPRELLCVGILGVFQLGIPYILLALASGYCSPLAMNLILAVEPLLNPVWVAIFDGEMPGISGIIGGLVIIVAVTVNCVRNNA